MVQNLEFIFLGTGTSAGVPVIGCDCPVCTSEDPRDRRLRTSAAIRFKNRDGEERVILIDTSPDLREQVLRARLRRCDAIVYTHNHADHIFGLDDVRRFNVLMNAPIDMYADDHTMEALRRVYQYIFERDGNVNNSFVATIIGHRIDPDRPFDLHGIRLTPLRLLHGRLPVLGYRLEVLDDQDVAAVQPDPFPLAYCTDVSAIPPETWPRLTGLRTLVLDMLRFRRHATHLCCDQAIDIAHRVRAEQTYFVHMGHDLQHAIVDADLPERMALAYDDLRLGHGAPVDAG